MLHNSWNNFINILLYCSWVSLDTFWIVNKNPLPHDLGKVKGSCDWSHALLSNGKRIWDRFCEDVIEYVREHNFKLLISLILLKVHCVLFYLFFFIRSRNNQLIYSIHMSFNNVLFNSFLFYNLLLSLKISFTWLRILFVLFRRLHWRIIGFLK